MASVVLTKWGNSLGIRIPQAILKEIGLTAGEELELMVDEKNTLTLIPKIHCQTAWLEQFNAIADTCQEDQPFEISNDFDKDEWTW